MYQTSQEYKDSMKRPIREQSFMKVLSLCVRMERIR